MAVNIFTYQPGATLPFVEKRTSWTRFADVARPGNLSPPVCRSLSAVTAGVCDLDGKFFVPAVVRGEGKTPASYIYYKNVNREPLGG